MTAPYNSDFIHELGAVYPQRKEFEWQDWTPTLTQSGSVTFTVTFARYRITVKTVELRARLAVTGSGTTGNAIIIGNLPFSIANTSGIIGTIRILDTGTAFYVGALGVSTSTSLNGAAHNESNLLGITPNFALANGDFIDIVGTYERS